MNNYHAVLELINLSTEGLVCLRAMGILGIDSVDDTDKGMVQDNLKNKYIMNLKRKGMY